MKVWGFGETIRSQGASYRDRRWERKKHWASLCTEFASWCADDLLGPITLILINEHTTYNLSEKCEKKKIWHVFGGCKHASPQIWKHLPQTAGLGVVMETTLQQGYDTEIWFKSLLWNACVKNLPWSWPRQGGVLRGKAGTLYPRELGGEDGSPTHWYAFIFHQYAQYGAWLCRGLWGWGWRHRLALQWLCIDNFWCQQINLPSTYSELSTVLSDLRASPHLILTTTPWMN